MRTAAATLAAAALLAGCGPSTEGAARSATSGTGSPPTTAAATVTGDQLPGLTLPIDQVEKIIGTALSENNFAPQRRVTFTPPPTLDNPDCASYWVVGSKATYEGSGWIDSWGTVGANAPMAPIPQRFSQPQAAVTEFLTTYPSPAVAKSALQVIAAALQKCQMNQFNVENMSWFTEQVAYSQPTVVAGSMFEIDSRHEGCAVRAAAKSNVVVELHVCGDKDAAGAQADSVIKAALARIPG